MEKTLITKAVWYLIKTLFNILVERVDNKLGAKDIENIEKQFKL
ncbi:MAG: hypothetical protein ACRC0G_12175 [Fusobacteriaceae bacterium]